MAAFLQYVSLSFSMVPLSKEFCTPITSDGPWQWWLGCSWALSPWSKVDKKKPGEAILPKLDVPYRVRARNSISLGSHELQGVSDLPRDQLLTGWWCQLRETVLNHYKLVTAKFCLKMEKQFLAHCFGNSSASKVVSVPRQGHHCHNWAWAERA